MPKIKLTPVNGNAVVITARSIDPSMPIKGGSNTVLRRPVKIGNAEFKEGETKTFGPGTKCEIDSRPAVVGSVELYGADEDSVVLTVKA